jgi:hypothetical protein
MFLGSVLAEKPERIRALFPTMEPNDRGAYAVYLYKCGVRREVVVDDSFPCRPNVRPVTLSGWLSCGAVSQPMRTMVQGRGAGGGGLQTGAAILAPQ